MGNVLYIEIEEEEEHEKERLKGKRRGDGKAYKHLNTVIAREVGFVRKKVGEKECRLFMRLSQLGIAFFLFWLKQTSISETERGVSVATLPA